MMILRIIASPFSLFTKEGIVMKQSKKIVKALEIRIKDFKGITDRPRMKFHQPGSLNKKRS